MFRYFCILVLFFVASIHVSAQSDYPDDYLSKDFHKGRRDAFRALMPDNSVAAVFSYSERLFSNDVNYFYHPNPDLYYLSGYKEPDALLLIFKEIQENGSDRYNEIFFVRKRDPIKETWDGKRLGVEGVKEKLGFSHVFNGQDFFDYPIDFGKFSLIIHDAFPVDMIDDLSGYDVQGLMESFRMKANLEYDREKIQLQNMHKSIKKWLSPENLDYYSNYCRKIALVNAAVREDSVIRKIIRRPAISEIKNIKNVINIQSTGVNTFRDITTTLREVKTPEELVLMRKAIEMTCIGHNEVMKAVHPKMGENQAHGIHLFIHKYYGSEDPGYPPIVGGGANGCILHYIDNVKRKLNNDLLLMDVGAEYHGYTADVTRTIPAKGKFSPEQRAIYELVYEAQEAVLSICREGTLFRDLELTAIEVIGNGLLKLGIIKKFNEVRTYYPHGVSHYLGLDVHDKGMYGPLKANSVITVEPGIYIPTDSKCDKKWWNIGVRIEDNILILKDGYENLSVMSPRTWKDIEKMVSKKSKLNDLKLPVIR
ncbi:MAG: aminopeptidase P N-terminal domain-containing protein [Saprospiraceae bacterium]|nr:aminopeptidase P N-terminal domain-containing protein [Saprospiraceae bacterium]